MFTICTNNYIAKVLVFNVLNSYKKTEDVTALYEKACAQVKTGAYTLDTYNEFKLWHRALSAYAPTTKSEQTVHKAMMNAVQFELDDLECIKQEMYADCMD